MQPDAHKHLPAHPGRFAFWLNHARPGERFVYHVGHLAVDRVTLITDASGRTTYLPIEPVNALANMAWEAAREGTVTLVQRKVGTGAWAYEAVKRPRIEREN